MARKLISGTPLDRLSGLEPLLAAARGASVIDIGCHKGFVSYAFACAGAREIQAFDAFAPAVAIAHALLEDFGIPFRAEIADFKYGLPPGLLESADIVLYLGVHHHLARQCSPSALEEFASALAKRARRYFAVRTNETQMAAIDKLTALGGLELKYRSAFNANVGPLQIYERPAEQPP